MSDNKNKHALLPSGLSWAKVAATPFSDISGVIPSSSPLNIKRLAVLGSKSPTLAKTNTKVLLPSDKSWAEVAVTLPSPSIPKKVWKVNRPANNLLVSPGSPSTQPASTLNSPSIVVEISKAIENDGDEGLTPVIIKSGPLVSSDLATKSHTNPFNRNDELPSTELDKTSFTTDDYLSISSSALSSNMPDTTSLTTNDDLPKPSDPPPALPNRALTITNTDQFLSSNPVSHQSEMDFSATIPDAGPTASKNAKKNHRRKEIEKAKKAQGFVIKEVEGKGRGLVAFKSFKQGQQIFREAPLLRGDRGSRVWIVVEALFTALSPENQAKVIALDDRYGCKCGKVAEECTESPLEKRWFGSAFSKDVGKIRGEYLFSSASLLNHSCDPNGALIFASNGDIVFFARKEIKKGDELTFSYRINQKGSHRSRQLLLLKEYGFKCCCIACIGEQTLKDEPSGMLLYHQELPTTIDEAAALGLLIDEKAATIGLLSEEEEDRRMKVIKWGEGLLLALAAEDPKLCESVIEYRGVYGAFPDPVNLDLTGHLDISKQRSILQTMNDYNLREELLEHAIRMRIAGAVKVVQLEWNSSIDRQVEQIKNAQINSLLKKHLERLVRTAPGSGPKSGKTSDKAVGSSSKLKPGQKSEDISNNEAAETVDSSSKLEVEVKTENAAEVFYDFEDVACLGLEETK